MRPLVAGLAASGSAVALGLTVLLETAMVTAAYAQASIGADTPISGITIGIIVATSATGLYAVIRGGKYLIEAGMTIAKWAELLNANVALVTQVRILTEEVAALQRWRTHVDPVLTSLPPRREDGPERPRTITSRSSESLNER